MCDSVERDEDRIRYEHVGDWKRDLVLRVLDEGNHGSCQQAVIDMLEESFASRKADDLDKKEDGQEEGDVRASSRKTNGRRIYTNPACNNMHELAMWHHESEHGARVADAGGEGGARAIRRAHFRRTLCLYGSVESMPVRTKRRLYEKMRKEGELSQYTFFPEIGMTGTQFAIMHEIGRTTKLNMKTSDASLLAKDLARHFPASRFHLMKNILSASGVMR